ncbi:MAG: type II CRISPR RNA-guided endonuclease Cas9 [Endomicrobia bacterium]|nr:type II CRISPR RNA-guided endonuclease Cas9 [Endomicrobiia bacterium]MCL2506342.1 type II CRISPR RNA-guided endonuclease Cas9 [Endomicrobiia bacterium]
MKYRLGIDLGTSSIGIAAFSLKENNEIDDLIYMDSYIFGEPVNPKAMVTLNTDRRSARLIRRQIERKAKRLKKLTYIVKSIGVSKENLDAIKDSDVIALRAKAISEKLTLPELIKVFSHIVKNRGYKGDLKRAEGDVGSKIKETKSMLGDKTLGQLLYEKREAAENNTPWRKLNQDGTFITRDIIEDEFEKIWQKQINHHEELKGNYQITYKEMFTNHAGKDEVLLKDAFFSAMFYQRPIKWKPETVGFCSLEEDEYRSAVAQPVFQKYRLAANIANLRVKTLGSKEECSLTEDEIKKIYDFVCENFKLYNDRAKISYKLIYEKLGFRDNEKFTIDRAKGDAAKDAGLKGITTLQAFYNCDKEDFKFINAFNSLSEKVQELAMEFLANITKYADIQENEDGYIDLKFPELTKNVKNKTEEDNQKAIMFIKMLRKEEIFYNNKFDLEQGRASYSIKALNRIIPELLKSENEQNIINKLYPPKSESQENPVLRDYEKVATNNPVIDKVLREFKRTMDFIVKKFDGNPAEMTIELTRELKNSLAKRSYIEKQNQIAQDDRTKAINELKSHNIYLSGENIEKYLLRQEQDNHCPYCGQTLSIGDIVNNTQIDHIIPQAIGGPNIFSNKILAHTKCNHDKGNKIPYEYKFQKDIEDYIAFLQEKKKSKKAGKDEKIDFRKDSSLINLVKSLWQKYTKESKGYYDKRKRKWTATQKGKRLLDKINFILTKPDEIKDIIGEFSNLHLNSTAWINKIIMDWSKDICPKVTPSFGALTAYLRSKWNFSEILPLVRISEGKKLFDENDKEIDSKKWQELWIKHDLSLSNTKTLMENFEDYINDLEESDKPINDTDKQEQFKKICQDLRQENKFNKRCDHRHHAVDAAIIGLSTLSLIQQASQHNAKYGGLYEVKNDKGEVEIPHFEIKKEDALLYKIIKEKALKYLTNFVVWHKPDHFPSGAFFKDFAYDAVKILKGDENERFVKKYFLSDILGKETNLDKLIKKLNVFVEGNTLKQEIIKQLQERTRKGLSLKDAFLGENENDGIFYRGHKVKKLRGIYQESYYKEERDKKITLVNKKGQKIGNKYYMNDGFACMDFDAENRKRINIIPIATYYRDYFNKPIPNNIIRIFIGDILFDKKNNNFYKVQSFKFRDGLHCILHSEVNDDGRDVNSLKDMLLIKTRSDIAKIKNGK